MPDVTTVWDIQRMQGDWLLDGLSLQSGDDLQTAVLSRVTRRRTAIAAAGGATILSIRSARACGC